MNREEHVPLADPNRQRLIKTFASLANLTIDDIHHLTTLAVLIRSGRIVPSRDLSPVALERLPATAEAAPMPSWAQLSAEGNLTIDLGQVETFTITTPTGRRRLLIGARAGVQIAVDGERFDVTRRELPGGDDWLIAPKPAGAP
ncbi:hypothetical protein [Inquilinus sp. CA228]|uniref:hypothetical protein n=1 Tax=Inquilinus sp. CA228 TaxID=3455609 RepID=UPI003F8CFD70